MGRLSVDVLLTFSRSAVYGWRNAEIENLEKMLKGKLLTREQSNIVPDGDPNADFKPVQQIFLEQNYRSTGAILGAALAIVRQGKLCESLTSSH